MKKRIYWVLLLLSAVGVLCASALTLAVTSQRSMRQAEQYINDLAQSISQSYDYVDEASYEKILQGREKVGKKGVVRDPAVHKEVIEMVISYAKSISFGVRHLEFSPIKGPEGNIEYLVHLVRLPDGVTEEETNVDVDAVVKSAHDTLDK